MVNATPAQFIVSRLAKHDEVLQAIDLDGRLVDVHRNEYPSFILAVVSTARVEPAVIEEFTADDRVDFVCNIPREAVWTGGAIELVQAKGKAWGGVGDLLSAAARRDPAREYVRREYEFIERIFDQHSAVKRTERLYDRVYRLHRASKPLVDVVLVNEYDLTADHVRTAWERYGPVTDILANNPNCRFTSEAVCAAEQIGVKLLKVADFMRRLTSR